MTTDLAAALLQRARRDAQGARIRLGVVTAINATEASLAVSLAGAVITGVRWIAGYTPAVDDFVVVVRADSSWVVLGKLSKDLVAPPAPPKTTITATTTPIWHRAVFPGAAWLGPTPQATQGLESTYTQGYYASIAMYESIPDLIPPGATILAGKLQMVRGMGLIAGSPLVSPVLYRHNRTSPPPGGTLPTSVIQGAAWRPGRLAIDQSGSWDLPSAWLTALLAGSSRGLVVYSNVAPDYAAFDLPSGRLSITYEI